MKLFEPTRVGAITLRNRLVMPAVVTNRGYANRISQDQIDYYAERAKGGVGLIVTEALAVDPNAITQPSTVPVFDPANREGLARLAEAVRRHGCHLLGQLFHLGRHHVAAPGAVSVSATGLHDPASWAVPHRLRTDEVQAMVSAFVDGAATLHQAGFSGVELHGAQGFLILQFLSPVNRREDGWGGDLEGRTRLAREIAAGIRQSCGTNFLIGFKMPADEGLGPNGIALSDTLAIVERLAKDGIIDLFSFGQGGPGPTFDQHVPDMTFPPMPFTGALKELRAAASGVPIVGLGRITSLADAERLIADAACDLIGMARPLLADPAWPMKMQEGRAAEVRSCIYCNSCWSMLPKSQKLSCIVNPLLGIAGEADWRLELASVRRRITIVGGGPAGLEAAWIAAARGHQVTLYDADEEPGGLSAWQARLPGRQDVRLLHEFQLRRAEEHGVDIRRGTRVDAPSVIRDAPDMVILATGSRLSWPAGLPDGTDAVDIVSETRGLLSDDKPRAGTAVIFDQTATEAVYAAVDLLASRYDRVVLLCPRPSIASESALISQPGIVRRLRAGRVRVHSYARLIDCRDRVVSWQDGLHDELNRIANVTRLVYATPREAEDALEAPLRAAGIEVRLIGDALAPRNLGTAVADGHLAAMALS